MNELFKYEILGNSVQTLLICAGILVFTFIFSPLVKKIIKWIAPSRDFINKWAQKFVSPLLVLVAVYICMNILSMSEDVFKTLNVIFIVITTWYVTRFAIHAFGFTVDKYLKKTKSEDDQLRIKPLFAFVNLLIWILGFLFILNYLGFEITTVLAGLGIGGIAIALAAQTILGDLFNYFVIYFDKPFVIGDFLIFDDKRGIVEKIGIKSTRIRALSGELLIVSNSNLTNARVHNYKRMERRRVVFSFGVVYQTTLEKLKKIPHIVKSIIEEHELATFDRSHFQAYGNFSLDFENVYFIATNDYIKYMDTQQSINFRIREEFDKEGIEFAYPTQTLYLNKQNDREPKLS